MSKTAAITALTLLVGVPTISLRTSVETVYQVKRIADGDTITVTGSNGTDVKVRFACVDTAEVPHSKRERSSRSAADIDQFKWGNLAKNRLTQLLKSSNNRVTLKITDSDRYGRKVAEVRLANGTLVQQTLAREGLAMVYRQYLSSCPSAAVVQQAEAQAKQRRVGVWSDSQFIAPWEWRH